MMTVKLTRDQHRLLQSLKRKEMATLKKYPKMLAGSRTLLRACKKVIKKVEAIPEHANRRKRQTAYARVVKICQSAIDLVDT